MACNQARRARGAAAAGLVTEPSAGRNDRPAARRDVRRAACFGRAETVSTVTRARQTARASLKTFDDGARTHEENKHSPRYPSGTRSPAPLHTRSLRNSVRFLQRLGFF